jgi:opacity protein-like surface antigen
MRKSLVLAALAACSVASPAIAADTITFNSAPSEGWQYGSGNNYAPSNTAILTDTAGSQLALRLHQPGQVAPASDANGVYNFALGTSSISFDWGINQSPWEATLSNPLITLTNLLTGQTVSYNPLLTPDNWLGTGANAGDSQNSEQFTFNFLAGLGYDPNANNTYSVNLSAGGHSLTTYAVIGTGAVPEPATWAMMLLGFAGIGLTMRRKRKPALAQVA